MLPSSFPEAALSGRRARGHRGPSVEVCSLFVFGVCAAWLAASARRADAAEEVALAEGLFQQGRTLMAAGQTEAACQKFEESNRLDPATGTLLNLAVCNEARGLTATAWAQFRAAEAASRYERREDRVGLAQQHLKELVPRLSHLTITVPPASRRPGLDIRLDGVPLGEAAWNVATPIDPGAHVVLAAATGTAPRRFPVVVGNKADSVSLVISFPPTSGAAVAAGPAAPAAPAATEGVGPPPASPAPSSFPSSSSSSSSASPSATAQDGEPKPSVAPARATEPATRAVAFRRAAILVGSLGVASLVAGSFLGLQAFSKWDDRNRLCPMDVCASDAGRQAQVGAENAARYADVAVATGVVALAAGGTLYLLSRRETGAPEPAAAMKSHAGASARASEPAWRLAPLVLHAAPAGLTIGRTW